MAFRIRSSSLVFLVPLAVASALIGWWVWGAEKRAAREARLAHLRGTREELSMYLEVGDTVAKAVEYCRQARQRSIHVPKACREGEGGLDKLEEATRAAEQAYLEACRRCASDERCHEDVAALRSRGGKGGAGLPCD